MDRVHRQFDLFIVPNFRAYVEAEAAVTQVVKEANGDKLEVANRWALAAGMNAAVPAYHLADALWIARPSFIPANVTALEELRNWAETKFCFMLRSNQHVADLTLLGAVVDSYKHAELRNKNRPVTSNKATLLRASSYGELGYGEGKYGGIDQVIIHQRDDQSRALSSVLQNVVDMWRRLLDLELQEFGR